MTKINDVEELIERADDIENESERIKLLNRAIELLEGDKSDEREYFMYAVSFRLACAYFTQGKYTEACSECEASLKYAEEAEDIDGIKILYYRVLIELEEWQKILALTMKDETHGLAWGYARLIAAWMSTGGRNLLVCANMFWDALILAPDVPFYMLGYYDEPEEDEEHVDFEFALMYIDAIAVSEELQQWFTRGVILFGLLTNRFDEREREYMLDVLDTLGGYEEYERMSGRLLEGDDEAVIEALAANKCLSK